MTNTELTLDQLQAINGGAAFMKLGDIKGECRQIVHPAFKTGFHTPFGTVRDRISGTAGPGASTFMTEKTGTNPGQMLSPLSGGDGCPF